MLSYTIGNDPYSFTMQFHRFKNVQPAILELATNFWLLVLSILHNHKRIIKQALLSHWVAEYNLKVSSVVVQNGEQE